MTAVGQMWDPAGAGVMSFPSGRLVRGRSLRQSVGEVVPEFGIYLTARRPPEVAWPVQWIRWWDFAVPFDAPAARRILRQAWESAAAQRVEIACRGGVGRTGTALACLAVLDGLPPDEAISYVRQHYHPRSVETPWQRGFVRAMTADGGAIGVGR